METHSSAPEPARRGGLAPLPWRSALDVIATVAMIAAAGTLVWKNLSPGQPPRPPAREIALPAEPLPFDDRFARGRQTAKVALIGYSDFQCAFCGKFFRETLPRIEQQYVASGRLRLAFRHYPLVSIHPLAFGAAESAECAGRQAKFWEMHHRLFEEPMQLERASLVAKATELGLDVAQFTGCLDGQARDLVQRDLDSAQALKLTGTPAFLFGRLQADRRLRVERIVSGAVPFSEVQAILDDLLGRGEG